MTTTEKPADLTRVDLPVTRVDATAYTIPTDRPEGDGTLTWDSTTMVLVQVATEDPRLPVGTGWTYAPAAAAGVVRDLLASVVTGRRVVDVTRTWEAMVRAVRNAGRPGLVGMAISAVDIALWDLRARLLGLPLASLFGAVRDEVPVYGSGGFTTDTGGCLRSQLEGWLEQGMLRVKLKIGESWGAEPGRDLVRAALARSVVGDAVDLFVDANGAYDAQQAVRGEVGSAVQSWSMQPEVGDECAEDHRDGRGVDRGHDLGHSERHGRRCGHDDETRPDGGCSGVLMGVPDKRRDGVGRLGHRTPFLAVSIHSASGSRRPVGVLI